MPLGRKTKVLKLALKMEKMLAPKRGNDYFLCSGGMKQMTYNLSGRTKPLRQMQRPNIPGKTYVVPSRLGYSPQFQSKANYAPAQVEMREKFPSYLTKLLDRMKN